MVPADFANYFLASAGAGGALVGLLFVAVSIAPERTVMETAPLDRQAVSVGAFVALLNAFFISLAALIPGANLVWVTLVMSLVSLFNTISLGWTLLRQRPIWQQLLRRAFMIAVSLTLYGFELYYAVQLLQFPSQPDPIFILAGLLVGVYGLGDWCVHGNCWAPAAMGCSAGSIHCVIQITWRSHPTLPNPVQERKMDQPDGLPVPTYTACHTCTVSS
jgi:hypothetical protein